MDQVAVGILEEGELLAPRHRPRGGYLREPERSQPLGGAVRVVRVDAELEASEVASLRPVRNRRRVTSADPDARLAELEEGEVERPGLRPAEPDLEPEGLRV
jgi:hypothetical protein